MRDNDFRLTGAFGANNLIVFFRWGAFGASSQNHDFFLGAFGAEIQPQTFKPQTFSKTLGNPKYLFAVLRLTAKFFYPG